MAADLPDALKDTVEVQKPALPAALSNTNEVTTAPPADSAAPSDSTPQIPFYGADGTTDLNKVAQDKVFQHTPPGALYTVANQAFGLDRPLGLSDDTTAALQKAGIFNDYGSDGSPNLLKYINEVAIKGAAVVGDSVMRGFNAAVVLPMAGADKVLHPGHSANEAADNAQEFNNDLIMVMATSPEGFTAKLPASAKDVEAPVPPSVAAGKSVIVNPKPWAAEVPVVADEVKNAPDSAFNGDTAHMLGNAFEHSDTVPLANVGMRPEEIEGLEKDGLAENGEMTREQYAKYDQERSDRIAGKGKPQAPTPTPPPINNLPAVVDGKEPPPPPPPSKPNEPVNHENPILDGSGNLNLDYIKADSDTKEVMADTAEAYSQKYGTEQSHIETTEEANEYFDEALKSTTNGIPDELLNYKRGDPVNTNLLWMARQVGVQLANQFARLSKVASATGLPEDAQAAKDMFARMVQVLGPIRHEMTATAGRTLNSMKIPVGEEGSVLTEAAVNKLGEMNADDAMKIAGTLETPQQVAKFVADVQKPSFADMGMYYIFNNYLSGPLTHLAYTTSWALQTAIRVGIETPIASAIGKVQTAVGKTLLPSDVIDLNIEHDAITSRLAEADSTQGEKLSAADSQKLETRLAEIKSQLASGPTVMSHEASARFFGVAQGAMDSIKAFGRALKTSDIQMLPGEMQKAEAAGKAAEAKALEAGKDAETAKAIGSAAYRDSATNFGNPIVQYGKMMKNPAGSFAVQAAGQVIGAPMRVIAALHSLQKFSGYSESMNALAYRQAATEGLEGDELANRIAVIKNNPSPEMMQAAIKESKYAALMGESGEVGKKFQSLANSNAWTRIVVPFSKVVTNLTSQKVLERTPIGLLSKVVKGNIMGENGNAAQATQIAKMLTGSTLLIGGAYLAARGKSFGYGSDDKNERAFNYLQGQQPYSVNIGDVNLPHRFFGVAGGSLSLGADVHDIYQNVNTAEGWDKVKAAVGGTIHYLGRDMLSENALTGPAQLYEAIEDKEGAAKHFVPNAIAAAAVPFSSFQSQINSRFIDPIMRQTMSKDSYQSISQTIQSRSFDSDELVPKIDLFGNPMQRNSDHSWAEKDPVMQALQYHHVFPSAVESKLFGVDLDQKQFADYATIAGKSFYQTLQPQVSAPGWVQLNDKQQMDVIMSAVKTSRATARASMSLLYPQIIRDSAAKKTGLLHQYDDVPAQGSQSENDE